MAKRPGSRAKGTAIFMMSVSMASISALAHADDATDFGIFWGLALAIEDRCEQYSVRTDAIMGGHLSADEYQHARLMVDRERHKSHRLVDKIGCDRAADEAVKLSGKSFAQVWEIQ